MTPGHLVNNRVMCLGESFAIVVSQLLCKHVIPRFLPLSLDFFLKVIFIPPNIFSRGRWPSPSQRSSFMRSGGYSGLVAGVNRMIFRIMQQTIWKLQRLWMVIWSSTTSFRCREAWAGNVGMSQFHLKNQCCFARSFRVEQIKPLECEGMTRYDVHCW